MNNSKLALDAAQLFQKDEDIQPRLREREGTIIKIIEALQWIGKTQEWSSLKTEVFDSLTTNLKKDLYHEAKKDNPDPLKLNRIAGQLKWAEKYSDLSKLEEIYRIELQGVRKNLYGKTDN